MRTTRRHVCWLIGAGFGLAACGSDVSAPPPEPSGGADAAYKLAVGDRLQIAVFGHPKHTGEFQVDSAGHINFPLLGEVEAKGRTVAQLRQNLKQELNENYIVDPKVSVEVLNYRPFFILGEITSAGQYSYEPGLTVRQAIAKAGGFSRRAARDEVILRRPSEQGMKVYNAELDTKILPGDTIEVRQRLF